MAAKFTVYLDKAKQYRFNLKAANGEIIVSGEAYPPIRNQPSKVLPQSRKTPLMPKS